MWQVGKTSVPTYHMPPTTYRLCDLPHTFSTGPLFTFDSRLSTRHATLKISDISA
jgi:hypothetical protein